MPKPSFTIQQLDINSIRCDLANTYDPDLLKAIARTIVEADGLARPLVVTRRREGGYDLDEGVLEYYAAVKAYEIKPSSRFVHTVIINAAAKIPVWNQLSLLNSNAHQTSRVGSPDTKT